LLQKDRQFNQPKRGMLEDYKGVNIKTRLLLRNPMKRTIGT